MRHLLLPLLLLAAGPAPAQRAPEGTGAVVSPSRPATPPRAVPRPEPGAPRAEPRAAEPGAEAAPADPLEAVDDPETLLRLAERIAGAGRLDRLAELLERAATRLLTRSELADRIDRPVSEGAIAQIDEARAALQRRDVAEAAARIRVALRRLEEARTPLEEREIR
jgi:hypothetical protein